MKGTGGRARLQLARPSATAPRPAAAAALEEDARLVVNMPRRLHIALKLRATARGVTMRDYVIALLKADGLE